MCNIFKAMYLYPIFTRQNFVVRPHVSFDKLRRAMGGEWKKKNKKKNTGLENCHAVTTGTLLYTFLLTEDLLHREK